MSMELADPRVPVVFAAEVSEKRMIHPLVFHNDRLLPLDQARLSPGQGGLLCGWGLFTTIRVFEGVPFAFERHWKRVERDAARTHCPPPYKEETVHRHLLDFVEHGRHAASPLAGVKTTSWLNNVWNLHEAQQAGFDEVVLLNERGEVAECTAANIFCVRGGQVATPPLASGCLEGVTRSVLFEIGPTVGVAVEECTLLPADFYTAEEVFISSTNRNLLPVAEINGNKIASTHGPVTRALEKAFADYVQGYIRSHALAAGRS